MKKGVLSTALMLWALLPFKLWVVASGAHLSTTSLAGGHDPATDDLNAVFSASYTDAGSGNLPPLTGTDQVVIRPVAP